MLTAPILLITYSRRIQQSLRLSRFDPETQP